MKKSVGFALLTGLVYVSLCQHALSQALDRAGQPVYSPPWVVRSEHSFTMVFSLKAEDVRRLLPTELEPLVDAQGRVNTTLEMYRTDRIAGFPAYTTVFIAVDVRGYDSRDGTPGHIVVWGKVNPSTVLPTFREHFGYPYEHVEDISIDINSGVYLAVVGAEDREILRVEIKPVQDQPVSPEGVFNRLGLSPRWGVVKSAVPYLTNGYTGEVSLFEVSPGGNPVLELIENEVPVWTMVSSDRTFSQSRAVLVRQNE